MYFDPGQYVGRSRSSIGARTRLGFVGARVGEVRDGYVTGWQGGNQITNWFHPKAGPHPIVLQETDTYDSDQVITEIPGTFGGSPNSTSPAGSTPAPALHSPILPSTPPPHTISVHSQTSPPVIWKDSPNHG